jgi:hypothetical protein
MTAGVTPAGAVSRNEVDWQAINSQKAHTLVRRLQARIVKVTSGVNRGETASALGRWQGLSGMQGGAADKAAIELVEVQPCQMPMQTRSDTTS